MNDKKKKKEYVIPEADLVEFANDDIITVSAGTETAGWNTDNNTETWW